LLEKGAKPDSQETDGTNALVINAKDELADNIMMKLYEGSTPDLQYTELVTAMVTTSQNGDLEFVELTTGKGPNSDMPVNSGKTTAFIHAFPSGRLAIVKVLLNKDAHFDVQKTVRFTDVMVASLNAHAEIVKLLAENSAKLDLTSNDGTSALIFATQNGNIEIVKLLLEKGANPDLKDNEGKTALDYAENSDIRSLLGKFSSPDHIRPE
jgi:ankyrin repeat protein